PGTFEPLLMLHSYGAVPSMQYHYHNDPNGCPTRLLDSQGRVVWATRYSAWGGVVWQLIDQVDNPIRLQGQYADGETGLYYNRHRYYDADVGQFISQDPIGLAGGSNNYQYGLNTAGWVDPLGLTCSPSISAAEITGKTRREIRELASSKGLVAHGLPDSTGNPRKWKDPVTGEQRLRLDRGHVDPNTGLPYNDPKARVDHVHAYEPDGNTKVRDPIDNNPHFPTTGE
ncbi:Rhs family protein, partial [hydrothermal vent metagenome]